MNLNRRLSIGTTLATGAQLSAPTVPDQAKPPAVTIRGGAGGPLLHAVWPGTAAAPST
jgi:hypothetical protein